jgi:hypothetical protein
VNPLVRGWKVIRQVGLLPVLQVSLYRFGLVTGHYRRLTPIGSTKSTAEECRWLTSKQTLVGSDFAKSIYDDPAIKKACLNEAELILSGKCRIFGNEVVDIFSTNMDASQHWTDYERGRVKLPVADIKYIWEPARLGWVFSLARAQACSKIPGLGKRAWVLIEKFLTQNPVNCGPNWMNGQEVALRILAFVFFHEVFQNEADMPECWKLTLAQAVIDHARRIPPTLVYARSQQNNHLLIEAAGLYTAGVFLPYHPEAGEWKRNGWKIFHQALADQIEEDGTYGQYSTNYHRLMLQIALWVKAISLRIGDVFPEASSVKLAAATKWLAGLTMPETGRVPNYGHNDGAYILPLTGQDYQDFHPIVNAAISFFCLTTTSEPDEEMKLWFQWLAGGKNDAVQTTEALPPIRSYRKLEDKTSTVVLFAPQFNRRPGQADLLHTEIWKNGQPIAMDAGTFQYNANPPWDNAMAKTRIHNTIAIHGMDQMQKAGRFLWLDWPNVEWSKTELMTARHDGYRHLGVIHERNVSQNEKHFWVVTDRMIPVDQSTIPVIDAWLNWLLPPLNWKPTPSGIQSGDGLSNIGINVTLQGIPMDVTEERQIIKAGELVFSSSNKVVPSAEIVNLGWYSPTYGIKEPAVSYRCLFHGKVPITIQTEFQF